MNIPNILLAIMDQTENQTPVLFTGQRFKSFRSISNTLAKYMEREKFLLSLANSKKLEQVCKKKKMEYNADLIYDEIYYKCPRAGAPMTTGSSVRPRE